LPAIRDGRDVLRRRFAKDETIEGYRKDGPVSVAKFELGEGSELELREARVLRRRQAIDLIDRLLAGIGHVNRVPVHARFPDWGSNRTGRLPAWACSHIFGDCPSTGLSRLIW
jgi:hypothetical protein